MATEEEVPATPEEGEQPDFIDGDRIFPIPSHITIKKQPEASKGILSHLASKERLTDDESLADAFSEDDER